MSNKQPPLDNNSIELENDNVVEFKSLFADLEDFIGAPVSFERRKDHLANHVGKEFRKYRRESKQRADYGLTVTDLWNFSPSYIWYCFAQVFKAYDTPEAKKLLELVHVLGKDTENFSYYKDPVKRKEENDKEFAATEEAYQAWGSLYAIFMKQVPRLNVSQADYSHDLHALQTIVPRSDIKWKEWRGVFTDPTSVHLDELKSNLPENEYNKIVHKHRTQRAKFRISDLDIAVAPIEYLHWVIVSASIYVSSNEVHGWDAGVEPTWEGYAEHMLVFAQGIYLAANLPGSFPSVPNQMLIETSINEMPRILAGLWD